MQEEPLSRGTQDADTAVFGMKGLSSFPRVVTAFEGDTGKSGSLSSFTFSQGILMVGGGGKEEAGQDIWVWQGVSLKGESLL